MGSQKRPADAPSRLMTAPEVAAALSLSPSAIWAATAKGRLPHYRLGRSVRFRLEEVLEALRRGPAE